MGGRGSFSASSTSYTSGTLGLVGEAIKWKLQKQGVTVNDDNTVTLYHVTPSKNVQSIMDNGFRGTYAPVGGMISESLRERSFFGFSREWVEQTWGGEGYSTIEIRVPVEYIRQGSGNAKEVYIEGNIRKRGSVWIPDAAPTSTAYDRLAVKRYKKAKGI